MSIQSNNIWNEAKFKKKENEKNWIFLSDCLHLFFSLPYFSPSVFRLLFCWPSSSSSKSTKVWIKIFFLFTLFLHRRLVPFVYIYFLFLCWFLSSFFLLTHIIFTSPFLHYLISLLLFLVCVFFFLFSSQVSFLCTWFFSSLFLYPFKIAFFFSPHLLFFFCL